MNDIAFLARNTGGALLPLFSSALMDLIEHAVLKPLRYPPWRVFALPAGPNRRDAALARDVVLMVSMSGWAGGADRGGHRARRHGQLGRRQGRCLPNGSRLATVSAGMSSACPAIMVPSLAFHATAGDLEALVGLVVGVAEKPDNAISGSGVWLCNRREHEGKRAT